MESLAQLLPLVLLVAVFWLLVIRPARKRQAKLAATQAGLAVGAHVMLASGFYGHITEIRDETVLFAMAPGVDVEVAKQAVVRILTTDPTAATDPIDPGHGEI